ncbi:hypothetical protein BOX15_Mlig021356g1, partial [Macrostomum lignano]
VPQTMSARNLLRLTLVARRSASTASASQLGFIGLGNMGASMATNLAKAGHQVRVFDVSRAAIDAVVAGSEGRASAASSANEVVPGASAVVTMLPSSKEVTQIYSGSDGLLAASKGNGTLFIDSTTGEPGVCEKIAEEAQQAGAVYIDAPVSGGVVAAKNAQLTFMCGGPKSAFDIAAPLLAAMGKKSIHCGDKVGSGEAAKICNNMLLAVSMLGTCEAMALGKHLGLNPNNLAEVLNASSGRCWSSEVYNPVPGVVPGVPSSRDYDGGFLCALMLKDLRLAQSAAAQNQVSTVMGGLACQIYSLMCAHGLAAKDFSVFYKFLQDQQNKSN